MPTIPFDLFELPHAGDTPDGYYPVVVTQNKIDLDKICEEAEKSTTLHAADVKAALSFLAAYVTERLLCGDRVELPELGMLGLRIGSDKPITDSDDNQIARNLKIRGISFTPKKELVLAMNNDLHFHRVSVKHRNISNLTDEEVAQRIRALLATGHAPLLTRANIQSVTGYSKPRTCRNLPGWIERGLFIKLGTPHAPYYQLAPEFASEPEADSQEIDESN